MAKPRIEIALDRVAELAGRGLTRAEIASYLGISETTLYNRKRESEEFDAAIKSGRAQAAQEVANALYQKAVTEKDLGAIIWYEKTRRGLSDKQAIEHSGPAGKPIQVETFDYGAAVTKITAGSGEDPEASG